MFAPILSIALSSHGSDPSAANRVALVSEYRAVQPGQPFTVAICLMPAKGWHTYWSNPGDSGGPTTIHWRLPAGWQVGPERWPAPRRIDIDGIISYGYEGKAMILQTITPPANLKPGKTAKLNGEVKWLVCTPTMCVPGKGGFSLSLPVSPKPPALNQNWRMPFVEAAKQVPNPIAGWTASATISGDSIQLQVTGSGPILSTQGAPLFFPQDEGVVSNSKPQSFVLNNTGFTAKLPISEYALHKPSRLRGVLEAPPGAQWMGQGHSISIDVPVQPSKENSHG